MMVTFYTTPGCLSSRKAKAWLTKHNITFKERNILIEKLTVDEIKAIVRMTEDGLDEIISTRSQYYKDKNIDLEKLSIQTLFMMIREEPAILRTPIMMDQKRLLAGFSEIEIRKFLPRKERQFSLQQMNLAF